MERDAWSSDMLTLIPDGVFWEIYMKNDVFFLEGGKGGAEKESRV